jgi:hypothetical protein
MTDSETVRWCLEWQPGPVRQAFVLKGFDSRNTLTFHEHLDRRGSDRPSTLMNAIGMLVVAADEFQERHA